jgi:hypothetical protein
MSFPVDRHEKRELVRDADRTGDVQRRAVLRRLRTVQSIAPPWTSMVPAFRTRLRAVIRFSAIRVCRVRP